MPTGCHPHTNAPGSPDLRALLPIVGFLVTVLINLVEVKFQGKPSPFETHHLATSLAVLSLLFYCSLALVAHLSLAPACCARAFPILMMLAAALSVASLMSLLVRRPFHSFPYLLSLALLSMLLLYVFVHVFRPGQPAAPPLLPLTRQHVNAEAPQNRESVQVDTAPDVLRGAHHQHTDFQISNRGSGDSRPSRAASDGVRLAHLQPPPAVLSFDSALVTHQVATAAEGYGEDRPDTAGDGGESVDGEKSEVDRRCESQGVNLLCRL